MFNIEKVKNYEEIFRENEVEFTNEQELKSVLNQMYQYAMIVYEQFKMNNKNKICSL